MPRPDQRDEQRKKLLPIVCQVFNELGYHRTSTAELAARCGIRENILYRLWANMKTVFLAAIDDISSTRAAVWALIGLATVSNVIRELRLLEPCQREKMFAASAKHIAAGIAD